MLLGGDSFWALEDTPKAVVDDDGADEETTKDVAEGTRAATVAAKYATGVVFMMMMLFEVLIGKGFRLL
jgi:hypothetical protein